MRQQAALTCMALGVMFALASGWTWWIDTDGELLYRARGLLGLAVMWVVLGWIIIFKDQWRRF